MMDFASDACDVACSICLDSFTDHNPAEVTVCNHEYHLQCIIEWAQRSRKCPICWRSLALSDPASQEFLSGVELVTTARRLASSTRNLVRSEELELFNAQYQAFENAEDIDIDERIRQHIEAGAMSRALHSTTGRENASAILNHSQQLLPGFLLDTRENFLPMNNQQSGGSMLTNGNIPPLSNHSSLENLPLESSRSSHDNEPRFIQSRQENPVVSVGSPVLPSGHKNPRPSGFSTFTGSLKSKFSSASSKCKESFSKGSKSFKEKLVHHNGSFKKLSKEVRREVAASVAGVSRMVERLDLPSRSRAVSPVSNCPRGSSELPFTEDAPTDNRLARFNEESDARKTRVLTVQPFGRSDVGKFTPNLKFPTEIHRSHP